MSVINIAGSFSDLVSGKASSATLMLFLTSVIVVYSVFTFYFYKFLGKKNIIELNLSQYANHENPQIVQFFAVLFYIIEYIIVLPILTFFWFAVLSMLILVMSAELEVSIVLLISAALVSSVRITSYVSQSLSEDLAKVIPFTLLGIAIATPHFFTGTQLFTRLTELPSLFSQIPYYLFFIAAVELIMRLLTLVEGAFRPEVMSDKDD